MWGIAAREIGMKPAFQDLSELVIKWARFNVMGIMFLFGPENACL